MTDEREVREACARLTELLDDVRTRRTLPAGVRGRIYAILDMLRGARAPSDIVEIAERIALTLHALEWARLRRSDDQEEGLWHELQDLATAWTEAVRGDGKGSSNAAVPAPPRSPVDGAREPAYFNAP